MWKTRDNRGSQNNRRGERELQVKHGSLLAFSHSLAQELDMVTIALIIIRKEVYTPSIVPLFKILS